MKKFKRLLFFILLIFLIIGGAQVYSGYKKYQDALENMSLEDAVGKIRDQEHFTAYEDVPKIYFNAVVAVEDRRFFQHNGFDLIGTFRAIYNDIKAWELLEGGSTISQQLAKNMYFPMDNTIDRKIAEIFMAVKIEKEYDKTEILELYVNGIYYGSGYYNIYDASKGYFKKAPKNLNDYECTLLAGIPNAPSVYSLNVNPDLAHKRQEKVLSCMVECGYITEQEKLSILE